MKIELELPKEQELDEIERKAHNAAIFAVFPRLEKEIKARMYEQLVMTYTEADDMWKLKRGQGIMEGMAILLEKWKGDAQAHQADAQPKEVFDKHESINKVDY